MMIYVIPKDDDKPIKIVFEGGKGSNPIVEDDQVYFIDEHPSPEEVGKAFRTLYERLMSIEEGVFEKMSDYIDRNELIKHIKDLPTWWGDDSVGCAFYLTRAITSIENAPAADVQEIKHGEWIEDSYYDIPCVCSCCGAEAQYTSTFKETFDYDWEENLCPTGYEEIREYIRTPFCSNCGVKMDGGN